VAAPGLQSGDVAAAAARARAAFAQLAVDEATFAAYLSRVLGERGAAPSAAALAALPLEDLYLVCACLERAPGAAAVFADRHGAAIRAAIARVVRGPDALEIEQQLMDTLLVGSALVPPKLASYAGKAPLDRWLGVAAQRTALMWLRNNRAEARAREGAAAALAVRGAPGPESTYLKERYRAAFEDALKDALARVPDRERVLLRLHLCNGVTVEKIGKMFDVSQATASRWLAAARGAVLDHINATLGRQLGATPDELASLAGLVASRLDLSLSLLLKTR
jgi:RNA polymerase sigma-70 factor (ECF subfamily)